METSSLNDKPKFRSDDHRERTENLLRDIADRLISDDRWYLKHHAEYAADGSTKYTYSIVFPYGHRGDEDSTGAITGDFNDIDIANSFSGGGTIQLVPTRGRS